jgi:integrase
MSTRLSVSEALQKYTLHLEAKRLAPGTIRAHESTMRLFMRVTGDIKLDSIRAEHVDRVFMQYNWAATTRNTKIGQLRSFFSWARGSRHMNPANNPMLGWRQRAAPDVQHLRIPYAEWQRLFDACLHPQERIVIATGLYLFLRASEQRALTVGCVTLQNHTIDVWRPKTRKWQIMPISSELGVELRAWLTHLSEHYDVRPEHHLICSRNKDAAHDPVTHRWIAGTGTLNLERPVHKPHLIVQRVLRRAGYAVEKGQGEHTLRRSGARALFDALVAEGYDGALKQVQTLLGHANSWQTEKYLGIDLDQKRVLEAYAGKPMFATSHANVVPIRKADHG